MLTNCAPASNEKDKNIPRSSVGIRSALKKSITAKKKVSFSPEALAAYSNYKAKQTGTSIKRKESPKFRTTLPLTSFDRKDRPEIIREQDTPKYLDRYPDPKDAVGSRVSLKYDQEKGHFVGHHTGIYTEKEGKELNAMLSAHLKQLRQGSQSGSISPRHPSPKRD